MAERRAELIRLLTGDTADGELRQAIKVIDTTGSATWLSPGQRGVLAAMKAVVQMYYRDHDPQLFGAVNWIEAHVERWRAEHDQKIRKIRSAA